MTVTSINPNDLSVVAEHVLMSDAQIQQSLHKAEKAFQHWRFTTFDERAAVLKKVASLLLDQKTTLARLITIEMGKVLKEAEAEIEKCAAHAIYFAEHAEAMLQEKEVSTEATKSSVLFQPIGCVFGIMPWNFPFWQVFRYAVPLLMAGNVTVLKHASNVFGCALAIEKIFLEAGLPEGTFTTLLITSGQTEKIIEHPLVQGISLTGSELAGASVAALAGKHIKKTVMELGGSDAFLVLEDADIPAAAAAAVASRMANAGQVCIAAKRFLVVEPIYEKFVAAMLQNIRALQQGDGLDAHTTTGPMARPTLANELHAQMEISIKQGAQLLHGGEYHQCHFQPSLLVNITPQMPVFAEETFGPLACVLRVPNEVEALPIINQSKYGLGASVWTSNKERGYRVAAQIEAGTVYVNATVKSDSRLPMGGIKKSGYGRELGEAGLKEFTNIKTVWVQ
jgi:succinate-semialdehyde dehydrogenase / glutarate-semialdehyde dehydrogenase